MRPILQYHVLLPLALVGAFAISQAQATDRLPELPEGLRTYLDGRLPLEELLAAYRPLLAQGWKLDVIAWSRPEGTDSALPIIALRTPERGAAAWFITGIHGEEPAGPNALAAAVDDLAALGRRMPVVVIPLANPQGYVRNWRYLNRAEWSADAVVLSVGDSSHLLEDPRRPGRPRAESASSAEAEALTRYIVDFAATYPPRYSIDLHEDNLLEAGYVYSQGALGAADPLAAEAVATLADNGIPIQRGGQTRFGEPIEQGVIGPVTDSSIDELMSAGTVIDRGKRAPGPAAKTVLVFETPARDLTLERRREAHLALVRRLAGRMNGGDGLEERD